MKDYGLTRQRSRQRHTPLLYRDPIYQDCPQAVVGRQIQHMLVVGQGDGHLSTLSHTQVEPIETERLVHRLDFSVFSTDGTVGKDHSVQTERTRIGLITKIPAIGVVRATIGGCPLDALVHPIPDETAQHARMGVHILPVFLEVTQGIAHGMGVFAGHHRSMVVGIECQLQQALPAGVFSPFRQGIAGFGRIEVGIHDPGVETADYIHRRGIRIGRKSVVVRALAHPELHAPALCTFVMNETGRIKGLEPGGGGREIGSVTRFVTQRPKEDAGMILIAFGHADRPVHKRMNPGGIGGQFAPQPVFLNVGLIDHVQAQFIAQSIPTRVIGVMGAPNGVDVGLLHQTNVPAHGGFRQRMAAQRVEFVAVDTSQFNGLAIDQHLSVLDFNGPEADLDAYHLSHLAIGLFECQDKGVQMRRLGRPTQRLTYRIRHPGKGRQPSLRGTGVEDS